MSHSGLENRRSFGPGVGRAALSLPLRQHLLRLDIMLQRLAPDRRPAARSRLAGCAIMSVTQIGGGLGIQVLRRPLQRGRHVAAMCHRAPPAARTDSRSWRGSVPSRVRCDPAALTSSKSFVVILTPRPYFAAMQHSARGAPPVDATNRRAPSCGTKEACSMKYMYTYDLMESVRNTNQWLGATAQAFGGQLPRDGMAMANPFAAMDQGLGRGDRADLCPHGDQARLGHPHRHGRGWQGPHGPHHETGRKSRSAT